MFKVDFKRVFFDLLTEYGYKYCPKLNYFIKVINDELIFFLWYKPEDPLIKGYKGFTIVAGCTSIYMPAMEKHYIQWMEHSLLWYERKNGLNAGQFHHVFKYNDVSVIESVKEAMDAVQKYILPILNQITDLNTYINYSKYFGIDGLRGAKSFKGNSLALIIAENHDDFMDVFNEHLNEAKKMFDAGRYKNSSYTLEEEYNLLYDGIIEGIAKSRDKVYADPKLYQEALEEAARRKAANLKQLRAYGIAV